MLELRELDDGVGLRVRVTPRASRAAITGEHNGALKVSLTAAPVDGAANQALVKLLAKVLGVSKSAVHIESGLTSRNKAVHIRGIRPQQLQELVVPRD